MEATVNAPEYPKYHGLKMFVQWVRSYTDSAGVERKFYHLSETEQPEIIADIYLGEKQIIL